MPLVFAALLALSAVTPLAGMPPLLPPRGVPPRLVVDGAVPRPLALDPAGFAALPHERMTATIHGKPLTCTGVALIDIVAAAGIQTGEAVRGPALATAVVARAADGYRIVFSLGEIERTLGRAQILVADRCNGEVLPDGDGPWRLLAAGDIRDARSLKALERLSVVVP